MIYSSIMEKRNKYCKEINTNHLIVLCEIGDDYKLFCDDLEKIIKFNNPYYVADKINQVMQKGGSVGTKKYKFFVEKHERTIEVMKQYSCLSAFAFLCYQAKVEKNHNLMEDYFYQYIQEHKEHVETIKAVALKIKKLGIKKIFLGKNLDFTETEYELGTLYDSRFVFLENMEVNPTYLNSSIKYRTKGSCYCLYLESSGFGSPKEISSYDRNIELNSLIFDPSRLPNEITIKSTIGAIQELAEKKKEEYVAIRDSVDFSVSTSDLKNEFERFKRITERIDKVKDNQELVDLLNQMQNILIQLQLFGVNFENQIIDSHASISAEKMKKEKKLYLDRRYWANIDID